MKGNITTQYDSVNKDGNSIERRGYLKLTGIAVTSVGALLSHTRHVRAESTGYGEGGYGQGPYGGESIFSVRSKDATNVGSTTATLVGAVSDMGGATSADCYFRWRRAGSSSWNTTGKETISSTGTFSVEVSGLSSSTTFDYQAVAEASDGDTDSGATTTFTTDGANADPVIESYSVTEAGSPNPHCEITVDWRVSDTDGNLDTVLVEARNDTGVTAEATVTNVSGSDSSGTESLVIKHANNETFDVVLTVIDTNGASTSQSKPVTE